MSIYNLMRSAWEDWENYSDEGAAERRRLEAEKLAPLAIAEELHRIADALEVANEIAVNAPVRAINPYP